MKVETVSDTYESLPAPSRKEVEEKMLNLLNGTLTKEQVADWASRWITQSDPNISDEAVWNALMSLAGADTLEAPGVYLHTEPDLHAWLDELQSAGNNNFE
jgi:hypothetical protein